ncbi:MAG: murein L,D-transpeptidase catalytic domain family protein [Bacteroidota bacterium]
MTKNSVIKLLLAAVILIAGSIMKTVTAKAGELNVTRMLYSELEMQNPANMPSEEVFAIAYKGHQALKAVPETVKKDILTVIDFSLSSNEKRLWIIDIETKQVLFNDYVAHGRNSGNEEAGAFSNVSGSYMSSIGFYVTGETYQGKHGLSLFLEGMDKDYNCNARNRAIVMHGADYVSADFIQQYGRLGRSLGCPSVSMEIHQEVINTIKDGSTLFIYYPDPTFLKTSALLNPPAV